MLKKRILLLLLSGLFSTSYAHEFWLQPSSYTAMAGEKIHVNWRNGMDFQGSTYVYLPRMATFVGEYSNGQQIELAPRFAAKPALEINIGEGTTIGLTESTDFVVEYENLDAFKAFVTKEHLTDQYNEPTIALNEPIFESYRRYAKTLVSNPDLDWQDQLVGQYFEWLLVRQGQNLVATLYVDGELAANYPVKLFFKPSFEASDASSEKATTDDSGQVVFNDLKSDYLYLINAVKLRQTTDADSVEKAQWHTDWASTTFQW